MHNNAFDDLQKKAIEKAKMESEKKAANKYNFDKLRMYFGKDFEIKLSHCDNKTIVILQPKIGDILNIGEREFYSALSPFLYNSTSVRVDLWKAGMDWNKIRDIEVFFLYIKLVNKELLNSVFKNMNFDDIQLARMKEKEDTENDLCLYSKSQDIVITEDEYNLIANYLRTLMNMKPKEEHVRGRSGKEWVIQEEEMRLYREANKKDTHASILLPLVSALTNHPGFKYKLEELENVGIYQFMDSVQRIQKYESSIATLRGMCSGFVDGSKIDKEQYNFMGEI